MPAELTVPPRLVVPAVLTPGLPTLLFDVASPIQTDFLGVSAVNMPFIEFAEYGLSAAQKSAEYDAARLSGIRMARTAVKTDWAMATYPSGVADWTSTKMGYFYAWLTAMQTRGINVVLTMGWHFPAGICAIDLGAVAPSCLPGASDETAFKVWVSNLLHQTINVRGFTNIVGCLFFVEPNTLLPNPAATDPSIPGPYTAGQYYGRLVTLARAQIAADDASRTPILPRIKLIGCEEQHQDATDDVWLEYVKADSGSSFDGYAAHSYVDNPTFGPLGLTAVNDPDFATWVARFTNWRGDASPKSLWADEFNFLVGGDTDSTGYRRTADAGARMGRALVGHMLAGVQAPFIWTLRDEHFENSGGVTQQYGMKDWPPSNAVRPYWYCVTMLANLCGGGVGTKLYALRSGETTSLHGVAAFIPYGDRWSTSAAGDWSFVIVNEGSTAVRLNVNFTTALSRTFYRYTYSGEHVPVTASNPAYLLPWDQKFPDIAASIFGNTVPARSVVVYSTMAISAPASENLALTATATTDSTGFGAVDNIKNGNRSNVLGVWNSWRKADNASHWAQLAWGGVVSVSRIELAFVATTAGVVWADYATAATPAPLADYTIEYFNGSTWVLLVSVTGNALPNRTHAFAPVSTTAIRLNATSAAATAQVNNVGVYAS